MSGNGRKYDGDKRPYNLLPPTALDEVVLAFQVGAEKYAPRNWELGIEDGFDRVYGALQRHAWAWWGGEQRDTDGQHHLAAVAWCALVLMEYERTRPELDGRLPALGTPEGKPQEGQT